MSVPPALAPVAGAFVRVASSVPGDTQSLDVEELGNRRACVTSSTAKAAQVET